MDTTTANIGTDFVHGDFVSENEDMAAKTITTHEDMVPSAK